MKQAQIASGLSGKKGKGGKMIFETPLTQTPTKKNTNKQEDESAFFSMHFDEGFTNQVISPSVVEDSLSAATSSNTTPALSRKGSNDSLTALGELFLGAGGEQSEMDDYSTFGYTEPSFTVSAAQMQDFHEILTEKLAKAAGKKKKADAKKLIQLSVEAEEDERRKEEEEEKENERHKQEEKKYRNTNLAKWSARKTELEMLQKETEARDAALAVLNKKLKSLKKKLRDINELEVKQKQGSLDLSKEQHEKLSRKEGIEEEISTVENETATEKNRGGKGVVFMEEDAKELWEIGEKITSSLQAQESEKWAKFAPAPAPTRSGSNTSEKEETPISERAIDVMSSLEDQFELATTAAASASANTGFPSLQVYIPARACSSITPAPAPAGGKYVPPSMRSGSTSGTSTPTPLSAKVSPNVSSTSLASLSTVGTTSFGTTLGQGSPNREYLSSTSTTPIFGSKPLGDFKDSSSVALGLGLGLNQRPRLTVGADKATLTGGVATGVTSSTGGVSSAGSSETTTTTSMNWSSIAVAGTHIRASAAPWAPKPPSAKETAPVPPTSVSVAVPASAAPVGPAAGAGLNSVTVTAAAAAANDVSTGAAAGGVDLEESQQAKKPDMNSWASRLGK